MMSGIQETSAQTAVISSVLKSLILIMQFGIPLTSSQRESDWHCFAITPSMHTTGTCQSRNRVHLYDFYHKYLGDILYTRP